MNQEQFEIKLNEIILHASDPEFENYLNQQIFQDSSDINILHFCIQYFPRFELLPHIYYSLAIFRNWLNSDINLDIYILINLKNIFFSQMKIMNSIIESIQISVQIQFFLKVFPEIIPSFWSDIFSIESPIQIKFNFLLEFANLFLNDQLKDNRKSFILMQMKRDNSELLIAKFLLHFIITERNESSLFILTRILAITNIFENEPSELYNLVCSTFVDNILPLILNDLDQMPSNFCEEINIQDLNQLKLKLSQIIMSRHQMYIHIKNIITLLYRILSSSLSQRLIIQETFIKYCEKINVIHQKSIESLNQLFDMQNSPLSPIIIELYNSLSVNLSNDIFAVLAAVSNFISLSSLNFNSIELMQNFYVPISLTLLKIPDIEVSAPIVNLLKEFSLDNSNISIEAYSEKVKNIFFEFGNRLILYYLKNSIETNDIFLSRLMSSFKLIFSKATELKLLDLYVGSILVSHSEMITNVIRSNPLKCINSIDLSLLELPLVASMIQLLDIARSKFINFSRIDDVLMSCTFLFEIKPPISPQQFFAISYYMNFLKRVEKTIPLDNPIFQAEFESLYCFLIFKEKLNNFSDGVNEPEQISEKMKSVFISIASNLVEIKNFSSRINFQDGQIIELVKTGNHEIALFASKILSKIPDKNVKIGTFIQCINALIALFSTSENQEESFINILQFIQNQSQDLNEFDDDDDDDEEEEEGGKIKRKTEISDEKKVIYSFLEKMLETVFNNENVLIVYLKTIHCVFGDDSLFLFLQIVNKLHSDFSSGKVNSCCTSIEVLSLICEKANLFVQHYEQGEWRFDAFCQIFDMLQIFQRLEIDDWESKVSEEVREAAFLLINFFFLSAHSCHFLGVQKNMEILSFIESIMHILLRLNRIDPLCNSLYYLNSLASFLLNQSDRSFSCVVETLVEKFVEITFSICKFENFDVVSKWSKVIERIFDFHKKLIRMCQDPTRNKLCQWLAQLPQSEQLMKCQTEYFQFLFSDKNGSEIINVLSNIFQFLHDICNPF